MTKLYKVDIPLRLAVEADSRAEAVEAFRVLWLAVMDDLPTGAGVFMKDDEAATHLKHHVWEA